jgi:anti-sigma factor RsiW
MTCELWRDQIEAYIDGELSSSHDAEVASHLRECAACNTYAAETIHWKRAVANAGRRYQPTSEFRQKMAESIGVREKSRWRVPWFSIAAAAVLLVSFAIGVIVLRERNADVTREIADIHLNTLASANPVDVISTDMHTVKPWFEGRVPFTFNLPELVGSPFTLAGGRVVYVRGTPCAQLLFQYRLHRISMLIGPEDVIRTGDDLSLPNGFRLVRFSKNGYAYVLMGDPGLQTLNDLLQRMKSVQN